ncbi:MAG TPA: cyclopropane-fatty-acyl-phospholipid synthase family protein [Candidatus Binatia bacterium]
MLTEGAASTRFGTAHPDSPTAKIRVHDPSAYSALVLRGSLGLAESYVLGHWDSDDVPAVGRIAARHPHLMVGSSSGALRFTHRSHRNTVRASRRNIAAHYDLGNDFFELFLDPTLTYSCAIFERESDSLEQAQIAKYDRVCRKLDLRPGHDVLEIGTGWGGFALHAARHYGCRVVTTTISPAQFGRARERVADAGLTELVTVLNDDYRSLRGRFDRLVTIEMIEAVGAHLLETFLAACGRLLRDDGLMLVQAILTPDETYADSVRSLDFLKCYVFPGGQLPSVGALTTAVGRRTDLRLTHLEELTPHYTATLRRWREAFARNRAEIAARGYPERLLRLWELYLGWCEGYFIERAIGVGQIVFAKPLSRQGPVAGRVTSAV